MPDFSKKEKRYEKKGKPHNNRRSGRPGRKRETGLPWYIRPGEYIYDRLPEALRDRLHSGVRRYFGHHGKRDAGSAEEGCRRFLIEEVAILFWGLILIFFLAAAIFAYRRFSDGSILLRRNPFGQGQKEEVLLLKDREGEKRVSLSVEEQNLTSMEREALIRHFFIAVRQNMCGKNASLESVNRSLCFDEKLEDYPFAIEYQPEDYSLISITGELSDEARKMKSGETKETRIKVTASYRDWVAYQDISVILTGTDRKTGHTVYDRVLRKLKSMEESSRQKDVFGIPGEIDEVKIQTPDSGLRMIALLFLAAICPAAWVVRRYSQLREKDEKRKREEEEDFPSIVHLLSLYMKAGLSFSSAVHRISRNCLENGSAKNRTAYYDIVIMDKQLSMGVSQKEACISWGRRCGHPLYQKLSAALIQILVKGSKEGERILQHMEREAFELRIDRARKAGKTAETRLLFPMIILLCLVMILVLFPAVIRFQGF